ncbi:hypothetical protein HHX47_DHR2000888 [Lentinula edodes]|nr:hypothetical protein HHX47_DHR2000888 [Lentinula edodes]
MVHSRAVITTLLAVGTASVLAAPVPESFANVLAARGPEDQPPPGAFGQQPPQGPQVSHSPPSGFSGQEPQGQYLNFQLFSFTPINLPISSLCLPGGPPGALSQGPQSPAGSPGFHGPPHLGGQFGIPHSGPEGMRGPGPHPPPGNMFPPGPPGGTQGPPPPHHFKPRDDMPHPPPQGPPGGSGELQSPHPSHFGRRQMPGQQGPQGPPPAGQHPQDPAGGPQGMQQGAPPADRAGPGGPQSAHQPFGRRQSPQGPPQDHIIKQQGEQVGHEGHGGQVKEVKMNVVLTIITMDTNMVRKTKDLGPQEVNNKKVLQTTLKDHKDIEVDHPADPLVTDMLVVLLMNILTLKVRTVNKASIVTMTIIMDKVNRIKVTDTVAPLTPTMARTLIEGVLNRQKRSGVLGDVQYGSGTLFALLYYVHRPRAEQALSKEDEKMISYLESNGHTNDIDLPGLRLIIGMLKENPRDTKARSMLEQYYDHLTYMDQKGLSSTSKSS